MAVTNFIPELWSGALLAHLEKAHVVANLVNRNYEGEIKGYGDKVRITSLSDIDIKNYSVNGQIAAPDQLATTYITLDINKEKYFNFYLDDVDAAQVRNNGGLMDEAMRKVAWGLADKIEMDILTELDTNGHSDNRLEAGETLSKDNIFAEILKIKTKMDTENVPTMGRKLIVTPKLHALLIESGKLTGTGGTMAEEITRNGHVGHVLGFEVYMSNNIGQPLTNAKDAIAFVSDAITFAEQVNEIEAYRPEMRFADAVKGLTVYGTKVTLPKAIVCLKDHVEAP